VRAVRKSGRVCNTSTSRNKQSRPAPPYDGSIMKTSLMPPRCSLVLGLLLLDAPVVQLRETDVPFRRLLDFDGDGDLDAVGIYPHQGKDRFKAAAYRNDGQGLFQAVWEGAFILGADATKFLIEVGRLNDDNFDDFSVFAGRERFDFLSNGLGGWSQSHEDLVQQTRAMALADLNADGIDDHIWVDRDNIRVEVLGVDLAVPDGPGLAAAIRILDADGDVFPDLFLTINGVVRVWHGSPGGFVPGTTFAPGLLNFVVDVGDIDGDLDIDAVLFQNTLSPVYRVLRRTGPSSWDLEPAVVGGPAEFLRDVDGDGDLDGVCCGGGGGGPPPYDDNDRRSDFEIALNDGTGSFERSFQIEGLGSPQLAGVADIDSDGDIDLVAGRVVYFARGPIQRPVAEYEGFDMPEAPSTRSLVDFDDDGDPDIGLCLGDVWVNDGTGFFVRESPTIAPAPGNTVFRGPGFPGDFDGDGMTDLLVEHRALPERATAGGRRGPGPGSSGTSSRGFLLGTRILRNTGSGAFLDGGPATPAGRGFRLDSLATEASVLGDLDADGDLDLIVRSMTRPVQSQVWLNDSTGSFLPLIRLGSERVEHVADLDQDGVADLVMTHVIPEFPFLGDTMGVLRGSLSELGIPSYVDLSAFLFDSVAFSIDGILGGATFEDFNGDGFLDMGVVSNPGSGSPNALLYIDRQGFGETGYLANVAVDPGLTLMANARMRSGDLDGDGAADVLISGVAGGPHISVMRLKFDDPSWFFQPIVKQIIPRGILVDVDGDGDLDVVGDGVVFNLTTP